MEYVETLKVALYENKVDKIIDIESACFQRICKSVEDAKGSWDTSKLNRDEFALGLISKNTKTVMLDHLSEERRQLSMVVAGRYV